VLFSRIAIRFRGLSLAPSPSWRFGTWNDYVGPTCPLGRYPQDAERGLAFFRGAYAPPMAADGRYVLASLPLLILFLLTMRTFIAA